MNIDLKKKLQSLELSDLVLAIEEQENNILYVDKTFDERINDLAEHIATIRYNKLVKKLIINASFKYPESSIESLSYDIRKLDKNIIINLATTRFISTTTNLIITGPTGSGKTYLACALGIEACKNQYRTYYIRMQNLTRKIDELRDRPIELKRYLKKLSNYNLLILDEWLTNKPSDKELKFLYELFELRASINSTIFVGQFPKNTWHERLGGGIQADSIMDRIIHNSYVIPQSDINIRKFVDNEKAKQLKLEIE